MQSLYKSRGHRGERIDDDTERKGRGYINQEATKVGGSTIIQGGNAEAIQIKEATEGGEPEGCSRGLESKGVEGVRRGRMKS